MPLYVTAAAHFDQGFAIQHAALKAAGCEVIRFEGERHARNGRSELQVQIDFLILGNSNAYAQM
jgi:hypothetical protein